MINIQILPLESLIVLGLASGLLALTLAQSHLFEFLRNFFSNIAYGIDETVGCFVFTLIHCHYCLGHWTALFFTIMAVNVDSMLGFVVAWLSMTACAVIFSSATEALLDR